MSEPLKQHLIDPEICIRCYTCENTCPIEAITHDDNNVVVDADKCNYCMDCIPVCPTGSIDNWRVVAEPYTLDQQFDFDELPEQEELVAESSDTTVEALDDVIAQLLAEAHAGSGGKSVAPDTAAKPTVNLYNLGKPAVATVQGNYRLTEDPDHDVRHIILDLGDLPFPVLEGQSVGVIAPGTDEKGVAHLPRLYSIASPRDGERSNFNNVALTVKRDTPGVCSNYLCDLNKGDKVNITGPFGATFLIPEDPSAKLLMICTGTGSAPMRAFTMRRQRVLGDNSGGMTLFFGARSEQALPYFGPLKKVPASLLETHLVYSRSDRKEYVQDRILAEREKVCALLKDQSTHLYICGLKDMEAGLDAVFNTIASDAGIDWPAHRDHMRTQGRYHVET
ncbi:MAG: benzoyl-CoA 2,3-epoxidase subunit BoxA [Pseudomonadota bacterium]